MGQTKEGKETKEPTEVNEYFNNQQNKFTNVQILIIRFLCFLGFLGFFCFLGGPALSHFGSSLAPGSGHYFFDMSSGKVAMCMSCSRI